MLRGSRCVLTKAYGIGPSQRGPVPAGGEDADGILSSYTESLANELDTMTVHAAYRRSSREQQLRCLQRVMLQGRRQRLKPPREGWVASNAWSELSFKIKDS